MQVQGLCGTIPYGCYGRLMMVLSDFGATPLSRAGMGQSQGKREACLPTQAKSLEHLHVFLIPNLWVRLCVARDGGPQSEGVVISEVGT